MIKDHLRTTWDPFVDISRNGYSCEKRALFSSRCEKNARPRPITVSSVPKANQKLYLLCTLITRISGICRFQSSGTVSKIKRKSRVWPGSIGAAETGWVST
jgi:hypothetical protein